MNRTRFKCRLCEYTETKDLNSVAEMMKFINQKCPNCKKNRPKFIKAVKKDILPYNYNSKGALKSAH